MLKERGRKMSLNRPDYVSESGPFREPIAKLAKMISDRRVKEFGKEDPEYWALAIMISDEEAELALKMGVRKPKTYAQLRELANTTDEHLDEMLENMCYTGVLEYNNENLDGTNPNHERRYVLPIFVPGIAEFANMNIDLLREKPELGRFFERAARLALEPIAHMVPPGGGGIGMHVIPVEKAISLEEKSLPIEHISHWLDKYEGKIAASPCSCRASRETYGDGCADDFNDWCIAVGDIADYGYETNKGCRYISKEEALEILQKAEDNGFVHQVTNVDGEDKIFAICNCNPAVCYAIRTSQLFNTPNLSRSAYVAHVDTDNCVACGGCVEVCPAGAVKLGQKLCKKDGSPIQYPKQILPSETKWGPEMWDENYRDTNKINCHETGTAPCKTACPAHISVQGYLKLAAQGKYTEALKLIKKENPFPAVCGRVCNRRCEDECTRGLVDQAVAIDEVKRFIAQKDLDAETRYVPEKVIPKVVGEFDDKIAIIGGGPAGLSCAYYLAVKGYSPTVFEKEERMGGMLMNGIPSFRLEKDVVQAEIDILEELGVQFKCGVEVGKDITLDQLRKEGYKGFYVAIGAQGGRKIGIEGEDAEGVITGVDFLRKANMNHDIKLEGDVVVIGGGNVAVDVARTAERVATGKVTMLSLESKEEMPADPMEVEEALEEGILVQNGWGPEKILTEDGKVTGIVFKKCISVFDENGKFAPKFDEEETITIPCSNVLLSVGQSIEWGNLLDGTKVELKGNKAAIADGLTYQTAEPDVFVGGDVYTGPKFAIDAIAAGKQGAVSLHRFVRPNATLDVARDRREFIEFDKHDALIENYDNTPRQHIGYNDALRKTFSDDRIGFTEEQVKAETARCLGCGASIVDANRCLGCGLCTTKCEFDAIHLHRDNPKCSEMVSTDDKMKKILPYALKQKIKVTFKGKKKNK